MCSWSWTSKKLFSHALMRLSLSFRHLISVPLHNLYVFSNRGCYLVVDVLIVGELIHVGAHLSACNNICLWSIQNNPWPYSVSGPGHLYLPVVLSSQGILHPTVLVILCFAQSENLYLVMMMIICILLLSETFNMYIIVIVIVRNIYPGSGLQGASGRLSFSRRTT